MWRSGSTYIWSRFRACPGTYCFYEPLNYGLNRLNRKRIVRDTPDRTSANAHPDLSEPYFAEYEPLLRFPRGVKGFRRKMSYSNFVMPEDGTDERLRRYIAGLNAYAFSRDRTPVLGFNASDLRAGWMNRHFRPVSIHINRDPVDIWLSYCRFVEHGNYTFFIAWLLIIEKNRYHPVFAPLAARLRLRQRSKILTENPKDFYRAMLDEMTPEESYRIVFWVWLASTLHALGHCNGFIDMDRAGEPGYAQTCADMVMGKCGLPVTFDDLRPPSPVIDLGFDRAAVEREVLRSFPARLPVFNRAAARDNLHRLSARKQELLREVL
jgi:hypothetical protein